MRLASLTSSVSILVLLGAVGLVAFSNSSIADSTAGEQKSRKKTDAEVPKEAIKKMQEVMEQLKKMQQSGKMPKGIPTLPDKARVKELSKPASSKSRTKKKPPPPPPKRVAKPSVKPLLKPNVEYVATSYQGSGALSTRHALTIHQSPNMARFQNPKKLQQNTLIYRYDKGIIWAVIPEQRNYPGIKLYQQFKLRSGRGMDGHIDEIMDAYAVLKYPKKLKNLGRETIDGFVTTRYQKRYRIPWLTNKFNITNYWLSDSGILMKVTISGPEVNSVMELKNIKLGKQPKHLFIPPPDYKKAGQVISWDEEKRKRGTAKRK
jgi:hypothetical protein